VNDTSAAIVEVTPTSTAARIGWAVLIAATLYVCYFSHLGAIGFVGPDEPRYAWIARDMAETGDWVTPRLYGKPWFEKPPLFYWGAALSFKLFGVSEAAARLPSAISALLATLALAWLALRLYGAETARWLLLLLPTTVGMIGFSHAATTDMPFSSMLSIAMVCAAVVLGLTRNENSPIIPQTPWLALLLFGFFLGLAVLAKGPAAIILSGGAVFFWAVFTKRWRDAFRLFHPAAIASFCLTALPWYIVCARRNADFFRIFIIEHNFKRYLTPEFQHIQPFWFYIPIILLASLPWTLVLFPVAAEIAHSFRERLGSGMISMFLGSWFVVPFVFFTLSKSKLPGYVLPTLPPLVLLCSHGVKRFLTADGRLGRVTLCATAIVPIAMLIAGFKRVLGYPFILYPFIRLEYETQITLIVLFVAVCILILAAPFLVFFRRPRAGLLCSVIGLVAIVWFLTVLVLPGLDRTASARTASRTLSGMAGKGTEILGCDLRRSDEYGYSYYLRREITRWDRNQTPARAMVILGPGCWDALKNPEYRLHMDLDLMPWPVIEIKAPSAGGLAGSGEAQKEK
jgi:4-amino-4-deoxy-L-arabinose transferase-like glycosyltransferase